MSDSITSANPSVEETISLYENLLKTSPNDSAALEALASAYEKAGNTLRARATLIRLSRVLISKRDIVAAARVVEMLRPHAEADFDALEALTSLEILVKESPDMTAADEGTQPVVAAEPPPSGVILDKIILNREMALAWDLCSDGRLKQEEYSQIIEDLTVQIAESRGTAISVLHAVVDRQIPGFDGLMQHLSEKSRKPFIDLSSFDLQLICDHVQKS